MKYYSHILNFWVLRYAISISLTWTFFTLPVWGQVTSGWTDPKGGNPAANVPHRNLSQVEDCDQLLGRLDEVSLDQIQDSRTYENVLACLQSRVPPAFHSEPPDPPEPCHCLEGIVKPILRLSESRLINYSRPVYLVQRKGIRAHVRLVSASGSIIAEARPSQFRKVGRLKRWIIWGKHMNKRAATPFRKHFRKQVLYQVQWQVYQPQYKGPITVILDQRRGFNRTLVTLMREVNTVP